MQREKAIIEKSSILQMIPSPVVFMEIRLFTKHLLGKRNGRIN